MNLTLTDWITKLRALKRIARPDLPIEDQQRDWGWNEAIEKVERMSREYFKKPTEIEILGKKRDFFKWHYEHQDATSADIADWWSNNGKN